MTVPLGASAVTVPWGASAVTVPWSAGAVTVPWGANAVTIPWGAGAVTVPWGAGAGSDGSEARDVLTASPVAGDGTRTHRRTPETERDGVN